MDADKNDTPLDQWSLIANYSKYVLALRIDTTRSTTVSLKIALLHYSYIQNTLTLRFNTSLKML